MVFTTLNIDLNSMEKICRISLMSGLSKSDVVIKMLKRCLNHNIIMPRYAATVEYQMRRASTQWYCLHIAISPREYEYITDVRKFFKKSVSLFVSLAVEKYYKEYIGNMNDNEIKDNYLYLNHILVVETVQSITTWKIYWGKPACMEGILPKE